MRPGVRRGGRIRKKGVHGRKILLAKFGKLRFEDKEKGEQKKKENWLGSRKARLGKNLSYKHKKPYHGQEYTDNASLRGGNNLTDGTQAEYCGFLWMGELKRRMVDIQIL